VVRRQIKRRRRSFYSVQQMSVEPFIVDRANNKNDLRARQTVALLRHREHEWKIMTERTVAVCVRLFVSRETQLRESVCFFPAPRAYAHRMMTNGKR